MSPEHGAAGGPRRASVPDRAAAVEARLRALATDLDDEPDPDFRAATRARLVAMAAVRSPEPALRRRLRAPALPRRPAGLWRARLTAGVAGAALAVTALGALVALATDARPGDALYGLKRGTEQTRLALAGDERGLTLLGFASTRLQELDELVDGTAGAPPADLVRDTLATMDAQTEEGAALVFSRAVDAHDAATLTVLSSWAQQQGAGLSELQPVLSADVGTAAGHSLGLVTDVGARAGDLQAALECPSGPVTAGADGLGPLPTSCGTAGAPPASSAAPPSAGTADPAPPTGDQPAGAAVPAPGSDASAPPSGSAGSGSSAAPTGGSTPAQTTSPTVPGGEVPDPSVPPPDGTGDAPTSTAPAPGGPSGPVLDTPLPVCVPPLLC